MKRKEMAHGGQYEWYSIRKLPKLSEGSLRNRLTDVGRQVECVKEGDSDSVWLRGCTLLNTVHTTRNFLMTFLKRQTWVFTDPSFCVWFSTPLFPFYTNAIHEHCRLKFSCFTYFLWGFLKPEKSLVYFQIRHGRTVEWTVNSMEQNV